MCSDLAQRCNTLTLSTYNCPMLTATPPTLEGHKILEYKGIFTAHVFFSGGLSLNSQKTQDEFNANLTEGRRQALLQLEQQAEALGANAIIDVCIRHVFPQILAYLVTVEGTAVVI